VIKLFFILLTIVSTFSHAAVPSVEGLFRNPNSQEIDGDLIVLKAVIQRESTDEEVTFKPRYYKFIFGLEKENQVQFIQAEYSDGKMATKDLLNTLFVNKLLAKVKGDELLERNLFYSYLMMYGLNKSDGIANILKNNTTNFISNKESLNKDKMDLYDRYKKYLLAIKNDEAIKEELQSPMESEDEEEKKKIQDLRTTNMYNTNEALSLDKEGRNFVLNLNLDGVSAKFTNEEHRLISMKVAKGTSEIEAFFADYILFNGRHELPKFIKLIDQEKNSYNIRFVGFSVFTNKGDSLTKRALKYKENEAKNRKIREKKMASVQPDEEATPEPAPIIIY
jgi:hypothetical protein